MVPAEGVVVGGKYELQRRLASGGMGTLWVAHHGDLDVDVAIKFMADAHAQGDVARRRFRREARAAARLRSPHVAQILDFGVDGDTPYIVMELLEGSDLAALLDAEGPLSPGRAMGLLGQIARGLRLAHDHGIVHRDLKPSNIFVARVGSEEVVKILDFGIAKHTGAGVVDDATQTGALLGSPNFMSPEQAVGDPVDHRSDLWSLGVVVFQMLTARRPFDGHTVGKIIAQVCGRPPPAAADLDVTLPAQFDRFFDRALHKSRDGRFQSVDELLEAFRAMVDGEPIPTAGGRDGPPRGGRDAATVDLDPAGAQEARREDARSEGTSSSHPPASLSPGGDAKPRRRSGVRWGVAAALVACLIAGYAALERASGDAVLSVAASTTPPPRSAATASTPAQVPAPRLDHAAASTSAEVQAPAPAPSSSPLRQPGRPPRKDPVPASPLAQPTAAPPPSVDPFSGIAVP